LFPQIFGKYVLERPLAVGGMARVFLATLRGAGGFEKKLVVKQIRAELATDEAFVRRFVAEAKTTVELSHPNIVSVYELGAEQGIYYLAMELCDGITLAELLAQSGRLAPAEGAYVGVEICRALDYAHRKSRVIHRDVTPRNILIDEEGAVRLIDFGIAAPAFTQGREIFGSPGHMPPEQLAGHELGPATDVFAVAALLCEAWSNTPPFRRASPEASHEALQQPVPRVSSMDKALAPLDAIVDEALALEPARRPQSAEDLARPLRRFLADTDLGEVARRLGARVRATREAARDRQYEESAPVSHRENGATVTQTFAARELGETPRAVPASVADVATRRMVEDLPNATTDREAGAVDRGGRDGRTRAWRAAAGAATAAIVLGLVALLGKERWRRAAPVEMTPMAIEPASASPVAFAPAISAPTSEANVPPVSAAVPSSAPARPASSAAGMRSEPSAHVRVTATPAASIEIDGRARGSTPLADVALAPGTHLVRLSCAPLGETVTQSVQLSPGEWATVSGDFTAAHGRILVRRANP
jgi:serine/threonine-protein kinase